MTDRPGTHLTVEQMLRLRPKALRLLPGLHAKALSPGPAPRLSAFRGRGMEFDEARLYQPGDEARNIDWRVTARRGEPYTKLFREERERPLFILTDLHDGMYFGTRRVFKSVLATEIAALIAWVGAAIGDRVGGLVAASDGHDELQPQTRDAGVLKLLHSLERRQPGAPGELRPGQLDRELARLQRIVHPGSLIVVLSDFLQMGETLETRLRALRRHNDLRIGFIGDPLESTPPDSGSWRLGTPARRLWLDAGAARLRAQWRQRFEQRFDHVAACCRATGSRLMPFWTADDPLPTLRRML